MIRAGERRDIPYMLGRLKEFARAAETRRSLYKSDDYVTARLEDLLDNHVVLVAENAGRVAGFIIGQAVPSALNPDIIQLIELIWWVEPSVRGTAIAAHLLDSFVDRGRETSHQVMVTPCQAGNGADSVLERAGFRLVERQYLLEVD